MCFVGALFFCLACGAAAAESPVARKILVLYSGSSGQKPADNIWRRGFDMVGNYYGLLSEYRDIAQPVPEPLDPSIWRGVVCAYDTPSFENPKAHLDWLLTCLDRGIKVIFLDNPHAIADVDTENLRSRLDQVLEKMGLAYEAEQTSAGNLLSYGTVSPAMNFERPLPGVPPLFDLYTVAHKEMVTPWLTVRNSALNRESIAVAVTSAGAMALPEYVYWMDPVDYRHKWYLDPFAFVRDTFKLQGKPTLTPTTLNGKRIAFSHIDADGFNGFSNIDKSMNCAEVMAEQILSKTNFPITASVIQAEIDPAYTGSEHLMDIARSIFALPNVEPGSHTFSHPFYWDPEDTAKAKLFQDKLDLTQYGIPIDGYTFDPKKETVDSCEWITGNLAPKDKPCRVLQWSGSCDPKPFVMEPLVKAKLLNINGGDTIYDQHNDSLTTVSPLFKQVGSYVQVFSGQANENILTNLWTGPYHAYRYITRTMERTGTPRRLMPVNAYYHFYSAEYDASLQAVRDVYAWILGQDVARIFTSSYIPMVLDFVAARLSKDGETDVISDYGACLSVRYDDTDTLPDLSRCTNVLGFEVQPQGLFVHLRPGGKEARIVRSPAPQNGIPFIRSATGWISDYSYDATAIHLHYEGFDTGTVSLGGLSAGSPVTVTDSGARRNMHVADDGTLAISGLRTGNVEIRIQ